MSLRLQLLAFGLLTLVLPWSGFRYVQAMEAALRSGLERSLLASATTVAAALEDQAELVCARGCTQAVRPAQTIYAHPLRFDVRVDGAFDDWSVPIEAGLPLSAEHRVWAGVRGRYAYLFVVAADTDRVLQRVAGRPPYGDRLVLRLAPEGGRARRQEAGDDASERDADGRGARGGRDADSPGEGEADSPRAGDDAVEGETESRTADVGGRWLLLATGAPGAFRVQETSPPRFEPSADYEDRIAAAWEETATGYAVEARIPLALVGDALGIAVIDVDSRDDGEFAVATAASWDIGGGAAPGAFIYPLPELGALVAQFGGVGGRFRVLDGEGWVLSDAGRVQVAARGDSPAPGLIASLLRLALEREDPEYPAERPAGRVASPMLAAALAGTGEGGGATAWYRGAPGQGSIVAAAVPIRSAAGPIGAVLLEQGSDSILTLTNLALARLMTLTFAVTSAAALGLLAYATLLSVRVRRLARAAETALGPKGEIRVALPGRAAKDEIGDLARSFERLLERLRGYTDYLRTLSSKLSHELRTPLAVVSTSLDNLEHERHSAPAAEYLQRVRDGAERLDKILLSMSEATRLEQAIEDTQAEPFDLALVVESCCNAYRDVYPERDIVYVCRVSSTRTTGSGELVAQLLDKLIDNAVSFSAAGSRIDVAIAEDGDELVLEVANRGPTLPKTMRGELFDSLVSIRGASDGRPHLGLGLHVVALIAKFHGGGVEAHDLPDGSGVVFRVRFPRRPRPSKRRAAERRPP